VSKNNSNIHSYNGHTLHGFKTGVNTKEASIAIMNHESISTVHQVMTVDNMNEILLKLSENNILSYNDITKFFYKISNFFICSQNQFLFLPMYLYSLH
jgi:hypothetical protein